MRLLCCFHLNRFKLDPEKPSVKNKKAAIVKILKVSSSICNENIICFLNLPEYLPDKSMFSQYVLHNLNTEMLTV